MRRHSLQHGGSGFTFADSSRNLHQAIRRHSGILGVTAKYRGIGDAIANRNPFCFGPNGRNYARRLLPKHERQRCFVVALAVVNVNKVNACRLDSYDVLRSVSVVERGGPPVP